MTSPPPFEHDGPEIVFGLVGAIGTPLDEVEQALEDSLREVGYSYDVIRVIELLHEIDRWKDLPHANEEERYRLTPKAWSASCSPSRSPWTMRAIAHP